MAEEMQGQPEQPMAEPQGPNPNQVVQGVQENLMQLNSLIQAQAPEYQGEIQNIIQQFQALIQRISGAGQEPEGEIPEDPAQPIRAEVTG